MDQILSHINTPGKSQHHIAEISCLSKCATVTFYDKPVKCIKVHMVQCGFQISYRLNSH
jgi:hypothetical protein